MADNIVNEFYKQWGDLGFYVSIAFLSFAFGFLWAAVIAYMMKLRRKAAYIAIAIGNIAGLIFWFLVAQGVLGFVDPLVFMLFVLFMSLNFFVYGEFRERSVLMRMRNLIPKEMGIRKKVLHRLRE